MKPLLLVIGGLVDAFCPEPNPCQNRGYCVPDSGSSGYQCKCARGFIGAHCEAVDPCEKRSCNIDLGHGECHSYKTASGRYESMCDCNVGFGGYNCERPTGCGKQDDGTEPCLNGGKCIRNKTQGYQCQCPPSFIGQRCEERNYCVENECQNESECINEGSGTQNYRCNCPIKNGEPTFFGIHCEHDVDECHNRKPCQNNGRCTNIRGGYQCSCAEGWTGENCEEKVDACGVYQCKNGGSCKLDSTKGEQVCQCPAGFTGPGCETNINDCEKNDCQNGSQCIDKANGYTCKCLPGWRGRHCEIDIDECTEQSNPCRNGGTCHNLDGGFECICIAGYTGTKCEINEDDCLPSSCDHGKCIDGHATTTCECYDGYTGLKCTYRDKCYDHGEGWRNPCGDGNECYTHLLTGDVQCGCKRGLRGDRCQLDVDECQPSNPCRFGKCINYFGGFTCECDKGYEGLYCDKNIDDCADSPCHNGGTCIDTVGSFFCSCTEGFYGTRCENKRDNCLNNPCMNGRCVDDGYEIDSAPDAYHCECNKGWEGETCEKNIDECARYKPCQNGGSCHDLENDYTCTCKDGYRGKNCEHNINECLGDPCIHGECTDGTGYFECKCERGWTGQYCSIEKNECEPDPCHNGGICQDLIGGYECINCPEGTSKPNCEDDIDECKLHNVKCLNGGTPVDGVGACTCECPDGFKGAQCQINIDDCADNPCFNHGKCIDQVNGYRCECPPETFGDRCFSFATPCKPNPCMNSGQCANNNRNGFTCTCSQGWTGEFCQESACHSTVCENGGIAMPQIPPYYDSSCRCECPEGFTGEHCEQSVLCNASNPCEYGRCSSPDGRNIMCTCDEGYFGQYCEKEVNPCKSDLCQNGGKCYKDADNVAQCQCPPQWTGLRCEVDVNECEPTVANQRRDPCNHGTCINTQGSFECQCEPGFKGAYCDQDINDCALNPCRNGGDCINSVGQGYRCKCLSGYSGPKCEYEENECLANPCMWGGTCTDKFASFTCHCPPGYRGTKCEERINSCSTTSCFNGGKCHNLHPSEQKYGLPYKCECAFGFEGDHCEIEINECESQPCLNNGICHDLPGRYECKCPGGFKGPRCEVAVNPCDSNPCRNGALCSQEPPLGSGRYSCLCPHGFTGKHCSMVSATCEAVAERERISINQICKNYGTCVNKGKDDHECLCAPGYRGDHCEIDPCEDFDCQNKGDCRVKNGHAYCECLPSWTGIKCENRKTFCDKGDICSNYGTCVEMPYDKEYGFACSCLPGTEGRRCELNPDNCLDKLPNGEDHCNNHGVCYDGTDRDDLNSYKCQCDPGYEGPRCESQTDYCESMPCYLAGTQSCVPELGSYECECKPGFFGKFCQEYSKPRDPCADNNPCQNKGVCRFEQYTSSDTKKCECFDGYHGDRCEEKYPWKDASGRVCYNAIGRDSYGKCQCEDGWKGTQCQERKIIPENQCQIDICLTQLAGNGKCDERCNNFECGFDGGDCSIGETNPWEDCPAEYECHNLYNDGQCDSHCNTEECLFDGFDCEDEKVESECPFESFCSSHFGNGDCDAACNNTSCGWDGGDCFGTDEKPTTTFEIVVDVNLSRNVTFNGQTISFKHHITRLLSIILRTKVVIVSSEPTDQVADFHHDDLTRRKRRALSSSNTRLTLGVSGCNGPYCFTNAKYAASYLGAQAKGHDSNTPYFNILSAQPIMAPGPGDPTEKSQTPMYVVMSSCSIILLSIVIMLVANKRKRERARLWRGIPIPEPQRKRQRGDIVKSSFPADSFGNNGSLNYNGMGLWSPTQVPGNEAQTKWDESGPLLDQQYNTPTNIEQQGPDNTNAIHLIGKNGTRMDKTGETGEDNCVRLLFDGGCDLNLQTSTYQETPLHMAAKYARADAAKQILQCGANPNVRDSKGRTPLHTAIASDSYGVFTIIANHNRCDLEAKSDDGSTALILAARLEMNKCVNDLIQHHVDVNAADLNGKTALHWSCEVNNQRATDQLLKHGANKDSQNEREETPLFLASKEGSFDCVELLLSHFANRELTDYMDRLPRDIAASKMHRDIVDLLERSTSHLGASHYEQTFAMNQYNKKMPSKKRPRVSAPINSSRSGQSAAQKRSKRNSTSFAKSSQNLTTLPGGFGSTTLSPPQDHHHMYPGAASHLTGFHTLGPSMNHRALSAMQLNPGGYPGSAPTTPARCPPGQPGSFYPGAPDLNQSMSGYTYAAQHHVYEQYIRSPISHAPQRIYEQHRYSMNYPFAFGDSPYSQKSREAFYSESGGTIPPSGQTNATTPRASDAPNDNPYMTLTPESNHEDLDQSKQSPGSYDMNATFSPGLNNPNQQQQQSPHNYQNGYRDIPQPQFEFRNQSATTTI